MYNKSVSYITKILHKKTQIKEIKRFFRKAFITNFSGKNKLISRETTQKHVTKAESYSIEFIEISACKLLPDSYEIKKYQKYQVIYYIKKN